MEALSLVEKQWDTRTNDHYQGLNSVWPQNMEWAELSTQHPIKTQPKYILSHFSCVWLFVTPWTIAPQAPLSMGFARQEYWGGLPVPLQGTYYLPILQMQKLKIKEVSCPRSHQDLNFSMLSPECWKALLKCLLPQRHLYCSLLYFRSCWLAGPTLSLPPPLLLLSKGRAEDLITEQRKLGNTDATSPLQSEEKSGRVNWNC